MTEPLNDPHPRTSFLGKLLNDKTPIVKKIQTNSKSIKIH